jgi:hypothetical protein
VASPSRCRPTTSAGDASGSTFLSTHRVVRSNTRPRPSGGIRDIASCAEIVDRVMRDARETIARLGRLS